MRLYPTSEYVRVQTAFASSNKNITYLRTLSNKQMQLVIPNLWRIPVKIFMAVIVAEKKAFGRSNTS